jgi:NADPH:quinone reductase-like Zn-dependent oxidoreductase
VPASRRLAALDDLCRRSCTPGVATQRTLERGITAANIVRPHGPAVLDRLSRIVEEGSLRLPVQATVPLEEAARAQELLQHGHIQGKVVLTVS